MPDPLKLALKRAASPLVRPLRQRLAALSTALSRAEARLDHLEARAARSEGRTDLLEYRVGSLEPRVDELEHARRAHDAAIEELTIRIPAADQQATLAANISRQNALFRQARREANEAIRGIWDTQTRLQEALTRVEQRVEVVRSETMYEVRYGRHQPGDIGPVEAKVVTPGSLEGDAIRLNLGSGHLPLPGYVNVDAREIEGVDVVADVGDLPVEEGTVEEIFSSHLFEHFPEEKVRRLLPYWVGLLRQGGTFRVILPDGDAMIREYAAGNFEWDRLSLSTFGGQEYDGDFHFAMYSPDRITTLLREAGLDDVTLVASGRVNGDCLEMEVVASKPAPAT